MKCVYFARHGADAHLIRDFIESCGIAASVRGEWLSGGIGELPANACGVWIDDDARYPEADRLLRDFFRGRLQPQSGAPWSCPGCGESLEAQFTACWRCGSERPA